MRILNDHCGNKHPIKFSYGSINELNVALQLEVQSGIIFIIFRIIGNNN